MHTSIFALTLSLMVAPHLVQGVGQLSSDRQFKIQLPNLQAGKEVAVFVGTHDKKDDIGCYLLVKGEHGYRPVAMEVSKGLKHNDTCYLTYTPKRDGEQARLWIQNNGTTTVHYDLTVDQ